MSRISILALVLLALPAAADTQASGFGSSVVPYPAGKEIRSLPDGSLVSSDGLLIQHWDAAGTLIATLGSFSAPGSTGAMAVDPTGTFVLVGQSDTGELLRVDVGGGGATVLGNFLNNADAVFESPTSAIVSAAICGSVCGNTLLRLDTNTATTSNFAVLDGSSGPVTIDNGGNLYYATLNQNPPGPAGNTSILSYSSAQLLSTPSPAFQSSAGLVVIEVESVAPATNWTVSTTFPGYTGASYYRWDGPDLFGSPGSGILAYDFGVSEAGSYEFHIHNRHEDPAPDQDNDCWIRVDGGPWLKVFSNGGAASVGAWNWLSMIDPSSGSDYQAAWTLGVGRHLVELSGRSNGFKIDRMVFFRSYVAGPMALTNPESVQAAYNGAEATTLVGGFDGASALVHDPSRDRLLLAEYHGGNGTNDIHAISTGGTVDNLLVGNPYNFVSNLDFVPGTGFGVYLPYQPANSGALAYTRTNGGLLNERNLLEPTRPVLAISGPGSVTGTGAVTLDVTGGAPSGFALLAYVPAGQVGPVEFPLYLFGAPYVHTALNLGVVIVHPTLLVADPNGDSSLSFTNTLGIPDVLGVQAIVLSSSGFVVGSSTTDFL